jgi:ribonuclease HII
VINPKVRPRKGQLELELFHNGEVCVGIDEVGRGCLAGPVHAAAVVLDQDKLQGLSSAAKAIIRDSKTLNASQRLKAALHIQQVTLDSAISSASVEEIEVLGILPATFLAMRRCLNLLNRPVDRILIDGKQVIPGIATPQMSLVGGDSLCYSIAAASILAKNARDAMMMEAAKEFPQYGFDRHVGYGTAMHLEALDRHGVCPLHRKNFAPIRNRLDAETEPKSWFVSSFPNVDGKSSVETSADAATN